MSFFITQSFCTNRSAHRHDERRDKPGQKPEQEKSDTLSAVIIAFFLYDGHRDHTQDKIHDGANGKNREIADPEEALELT